MFSSVTTFSETVKVDINNGQIRTVDEKKQQFKQLLDWIKLKKSLTKLTKQFIDNQIDREINILC